MKTPVEHALPTTADRSVGNVIISPSSAQLISDVVVVPYPLWPDDRGYFLEVARMGKNSVRDFPPQSTQISAAVSYPGTVKAFHIHRHQTDYWSPLAGMFQVALVDLGVLRPWQILIPPGVGHGYKVISQEPGVLVYLTDHVYNPDDELRIAYNDPNINYDWDTQFK
ncbi:MAG: dTDP-4-dehydrorhamnose 3,5-epimerase [Acidobacteriia bacterium 12-62-4]|nr:MAG: dTDP-4-dehydrorhamnose 3,5-epimerase [Acidobacteriia bacterium 12-62-4]